MALAAEDLTHATIVYKKAGFVSRLKAFVVDYLAIILMSAVLGNFLDTLGMILSFFIPVLYFGFFYQKYSSSPGKKLFGMKVVRSEDGEKPTYLDALVRDGIGKSLSSIILGVGYFMVLFRDDKRALHDLLSNTDVLIKE